MADQDGGGPASARSTGRPKKKSALARLAEKKRQNKEDGSLGGSTASLRHKEKAGTAEDSAAVAPPEAKQRLSKATAPDAGGGGEGGVSKSSNGGVPMHLEPEVIIKPAPRRSSADSKTNRPPLRPRRRSQRSGASRDSQRSPVPMDVDEIGSDVEDGAPGDPDQVDKKSPSDATIHRFRNLRMASERSESVESLKQSPFIPKPPTQPRRGSTSSTKGEKRGRDPYSSSEEQDAANKRGGILVSTKDPREVIPRPRRSSKSADRMAEQAQGVDLEPGAQSARGDEGASGENNLDSTLVAVSQEYEKVINAQSPRQGTLKPITPRNLPPPLPGDIVSQSLRTAYKSDSSYRHRPDSVLDTASQRSCGAGSVLQSITTKSARTRSFLVGSVNTGSSMLLGAEELDRYFPDRKVNIWVGSWNMNENKEIPESMDDFILPEVCEYVQDIYVVGTQENEMNKREWEIRLQETIGPSHVLFHSVSHGALHLAVFMRRDLIWFCSVPESDVISTRAITMVKTKGAIAIAFSFFGTSFLFINSHFTCSQVESKKADDTQLKARIRDFQKIAQGLKLARTPHSPSKAGQEDVTAHFDRVFWFGDLNFRIARLKEAVEKRITVILEEEHPNFEHLLGGDELIQSINEGVIFQGYQEGRINFPPTYKFDPNTANYDTSAKNRIPSYTDRILFRSKQKNAVSCLHYNCARTITISDHRPIFGIYETSIRPGHMSTPLAAGQFDRDVYLEANRRRAEQMAGQTGSNKNSKVCSIQ